MSLFKLNPVTTMLIKEDWKDILLFSIIIPLAVITLILGLNILDLTIQIGEQYGIECEAMKNPKQCQHLFTLTK